MKVQNMVGRSGDKAPNQFEIIDNDCRYFQSYACIIVKIETLEDGEQRVYLDSNYWNYSKTTAKYRNLFLGRTTKEIKDRIKSGQYILADLNNAEYN